MDALNRATLSQRVAPFVALLDARYLPLLFAVAPQAYAVFVWLARGGAPEPIAWLGALGYEFVYVGAIAWADAGQRNYWTWITAVVALVFSVLVAYHVHATQGAWAWLHAGFPAVAFCYSIMMHLGAAAPHRASVAPADDAALAHARQEVAQAMADRDTVGAAADAFRAERDALAQRAAQATADAQELARQLGEARHALTQADAVVIGDAPMPIRELARRLEMAESTVRRRLRGDA